MADLAQVQADLDALRNDVANTSTAVSAALQALKDQLAQLSAGQVVTAEQLDAIDSQIKVIDDSVRAIPTS